MSDQDINPFASPEDVNPFADPSVTAQTQLPSQTTTEYNPFDQQKATQPPSYNNPPTAYTPATIEPETAPSYQAKPFAGASTVAQDETMRRRQEELEKKAAELDKKEQELKRVQTNLPKENNFPPFPKFFPCTPCFYHDISADIPIQSQRTCKMVFYIWQLYVFTLLFNFICALALLCDSGANGGVTFGVALLYLVIFPPMSFLFWYRPLYKALKNDSSFNYFLFFFMFFFQIIFCALYAIGIPGFGSAGWINGAKHADDDHPAVAGMMFVCAALFTLLCILKILLLRKIHGFYRSSGASLQKAQTEFATGVASNQHVQAAAAEAVKAGVNQQVQQRGY